MVRRIYKFPIDLERGLVTTIQEGAIIRHVGLDPHGDICLWAEVTPSNRQVRREIRVYGTGFPLDDFGTYVGSVTQGSFVWHVYDFGAYGSA